MRLYHLINAAQNIVLIRGLVGIKLSERLRLDRVGNIVGLLARRAFHAIHQLCRAEAEITDKPFAQ